MHNKYLCECCYNATNTLCVCGIELYMRLHNMQAQRLIYTHKPIIKPPELFGPFTRYNYLPYIFACFRHGVCIDTYTQRIHTFRLEKRYIIIFLHLCKHLFRKYIYRQIYILYIHTYICWNFVQFSIRIYI